MSLDTILGILLQGGLDGRKARMWFYRNPTEFLSCNDPDLTHEDKAALFSMKRRLIAECAPSHDGPIRAHRFSGHWTAQGEDWADSDPTAAGYAPGAPAWDCDSETSNSAIFDVDDDQGVDLFAAGGGAGGGSAWADPGPHGRGFNHASASPGDTIAPFVVVGEGLLDLATIVFEHIDWTLPNAGPHSFTVEKAFYANFRRCYLETSISIGAGWPPGNYIVTIQNDPKNPETHVRAGQFFVVN